MTVPFTSSRMPLCSKKKDGAYVWLEGTQINGTSDNPAANTLGPLYNSTNGIGYVMWNDEPGPTHCPKGCTSLSLAHAKGKTLPPCTSHLSCSLRQSMRPLHDQIKSLLAMLQPAVRLSTNTTREIINFFHTFARAIQRTSHVQSERSVQYCLCESKA